MKRILLRLIPTCTLALLAAIKLAAAPTSSNTGGVFAAGYQHEVASKLATCDMTFADRVLTALDLETRLPSVFMVTANCSEASAYTLLGLPYEIWSGALFTLIALLCLLTLKRGAVHRR